MTRHAEKAGPRVEPGVTAKDKRSPTHMIVTLNLVQGPFLVTPGPRCEARWILNQVQDDGRVLDGGHPQ